MTQRFVRTVRGRGFDKIRVGLRGFHTAFKFHFDITQLSVQNGRALIDGVMHLRPFGSYSYPLRTVLVGTVPTSPAWVPLRPVMPLAPLIYTVSPFDWPCAVDVVTST